MTRLCTSVMAFTQGKEFWDRFTIRTPIVETDSFIDHYMRAGQKCMYDVTGTKDLDVLRAIAICYVYFTRETGLPVGPDYIAQNAVLFVDLADDKRVVLGALDVEITQDKPVLLWGWIHPQFRGWGMMTDALKFLEKKYGSFNVQFPVSHGMRAVLRKVGHPQAEMPNPF